MDIDLTYYEYINNKNNMLKSIYTNGGFYIGRYESGIEGSQDNISLARTKESNRIDGSYIKAVSQKDAIPYNYIWCSEAQKLASEMSPDSSVTSSLLYGIQIDLIYKFLVTNSELNVENINVDCGKWGNYKNVEIPINSKKAKQCNANDNWSSIEGKKDSGVATLLSAGASEKAKILNIYDLAGNEYEFSLQYYPAGKNMGTGFGASMIRNGSYALDSDVGNIRNMLFGIDDKMFANNPTFRSTLY